MTKKLTYEQVCEWVKTNKPTIFVISKTYKNSMYKMEWKCSICNYEWKTCLSKLKNSKTNCNKCYLKNNSLNFDKIKKYIETERKELKLLSKTFINTKTKMEWQCNICNYIWKTSYSQIRYDKAGCLRCSKSLRYTIKDIKEYVKKERPDLILLSNEYTGYIKNMKWKCSKKECSYEFESTFSSIKNQGTKCHKCNGTYSFTINDVKNWIKENKPKFVLLSEKYVNTSQKLRWKCLKCDYEFKRTFNSMKCKKHNCAKCSGKKKHSLNEIKIYIEKNRKDLVLLSDKYVNCKEKLDVKCLKCDYTWGISYNHLSRDRGCPKCSKRMKLTFQEVSQWFINERPDLKLLSDEYKNCNTYLDILCLKCNNMRKSTFDNIKYGKAICPTCSGKKKYTTKRINIWIKKNNKPFILLSKQYINNNSKLHWYCKKCEYKWKATFDCIKNKGTCCPNCASWRSEKLVRKAFKTLFEEPFPKRRPRCLKGLELDGYNKDYQLAFEFNGEQHYQYIPFFHRNGISDFLEQHFRDIIKRQLCKENNITLITIDGRKYNCYNKLELEEHIFEKLQELHFV